MAASRHFFVLTYEEPNLRIGFGHQLFSDCVPRWFPRFTVWKPPLGP